MSIIEWSLSVTTLLHTNNSFRRESPLRVRSFARTLFTLFALFLAACGTETSPLSPDEAMLVINMPKMKSTARAVDTNGTTIPAEIDEICFRVNEVTGSQICKTPPYADAMAVQFRLPADRAYTVTGTAKAGLETLYEGSEPIPSLAPGETRHAPVSLLAKIKLALSLSSDVVGPQGGGASGAPIQLLVGQRDSTLLKASVDGLANKSLTWLVNGIAGGDTTFGTVSTDGAYTPPVTLPSNPNIVIKAVPTAAPSFAAEVAVKLVPPADVLPPAAPGNVTASASDAQIVLSWAAVAGATEYRVFRGTAAGVSVTGVSTATVTTTSYLNVGVTNGTNYYYKIVAANMAGPGRASAEVSAKPLPPLPAAPTNLSAAPDSQQVTLNWTTTAGATEYHIYRGTAPNVQIIGAPLAAVTSLSSDNLIPKNLR